MIPNNFNMDYIYQYYIVRVLVKKRSGFYISFPQIFGGGARWILPSNPIHIALHNSLFDGECSGAKSGRLGTTTSGFSFNRNFT